MKIDYQKFIMVSQFEFRYVRSI